MAKHILMINGPNLNLLGLREPHIYGSTTLATLQTSLETHCAALNPTAPIHLSSFQSNHEGAILDVLHSCHPKQYTFDAHAHHSHAHAHAHADTSAQDSTATSVPKVDAIVINAAGLTHTSVVLRDALAGIEIPFIEVHITNVHARDAFRHRSFLSDKAVAVICGLGVYGYTAAVDYFAGHLKC